MKRNNKKGFTIVELVIVIAVIAILAAVLIPTFSGVVRKARLSADKQTVRQMNVALATGDGVDTYTEMADILIEQGYNGDQTLIPSSKGYSYYWVQEYNTIVLVKDGEVVFPEESKYDNFDANAEGVYAFLAGNYIVTSSATTSAEAVEDIQAAVAKGNSFTLAEKVAEPIVLPVTAVEAEQAITVDLAGSTLKTTDRGDGQMAYGFNVYGELTIENAVIEARGVEVRNGGVMTLGEGVKVDAVGTTGGAAVYVYEGGEAIIEGGEYKNTYANLSTDTSGATALISYGKLTVKGGTFTSVANAYCVLVNAGTADISNATITANRGGIAVTGGAKATLNNCTVVSNATNAHALYVAGSGSTAIVNGGSYTAPSASGCYAIYNAGTVTYGATAPTLTGAVHGIN